MFVGTTSKSRHPPSAVRTRTSEVSFTPGPESEPAQCLHRFGRFVGMEEVEGVAADQLVGLVTDATRRLRADVGDRTRSVGDDDELRRAVHDRAGTCRALERCRFASTRSVMSCTTQIDAVVRTGSMRHSYVRTMPSTNSSYS